MPRSKKPIFWSLFAGGGTITAFLTPVLVLLTLLAGLGHPPTMLQYAALRGFAAHWLGKLVLFGVLAMSLWHAAHRARVTAHDFGLRADHAVAWLLYLLAGAGTLWLLVSLLSF